MKVRAPAGVRTGTVVVDFCLPRAGGGTACLRDFVAGGAVLVWFYRGHW
ncbi:MAG: hypothetical protein ACRD12_17540 [Acidimicrobiales bacterium]